MKELIGIRDRNIFFNRRKMNQFYYTYAYLREDRTPYYIGKGKGNRIHSTDRKYKPPKDKSRIIFLKQNLTEEEAFKHEIYMIAVFGRKDLGSGILYNRTDGGDGASNCGTPEQRSESAKKANASRTPEQRSEVAKKARSLQLSKSTPEQRSEIARKSQASRTPEQRSEISRKRQANMTPEQRSEIVRKANANRTPEQRSKGARVTSSQRWQCTVTGHISNAGGLSTYQKARGIDASNRVRLS